MERDVTEKDSSGENLHILDEMLQMLESEITAERDSEYVADTFSIAGSHFISAIKFAGRPILPPLMTASRKEEMQIYKRQAVMNEDQLKARARQKLLARVQSALDKIQYRKSPSSTLDGSTLESTGSTSKTLMSTMSETSDSNSPTSVQPENDIPAESSEEGQDTESDKPATVCAAVPSEVKAEVTPFTSPQTSPREDSAIDSPRVGKTDIDLPSPVKDEDGMAESPAKISPRSESKMAPDSGISSQGQSYTPAPDLPLPEEILDTMAEITDIEDEDGMEPGEHSGMKPPVSAPTTWVLHKLSNTPVKTLEKMKQNSEKEKATDVKDGVKRGSLLSSTSSSSRTSGSSEEMNRTVITCDDMSTNGTSNALLDAAGSLMEMMPSPSDILMHPMEQLFHRAKLTDANPASDPTHQLLPLDADADATIEEIETPDDVETISHQTQTETINDEPISVISLLSKVNFSDDEDSDENSEDESSQAPNKSRQNSESATRETSHQDSGFVSTIQPSADDDSRCAVEHDGDDSTVSGAMHVHETITPGPIHTPDVSEIEAITPTPSDVHTVNGLDDLTPTPGQSAVIPSSTLKSEAESSNTSSQLAISCGAASTMCTESTNLSRYMAGSLETIESSTTTLPYVASTSGELDVKSGENNASTDIDDNERSQTLGQTVVQPDFIEPSNTRNAEAHKTADTNVSKESLNTVLTSCKRHIRRGSYTIEQPSFSEAGPDVTAPTAHKRAGSYVVEHPSFTEAELPSGARSADKHNKLSPSEMEKINMNAVSSPMDCLRRESYTLEQPSPVLLAAKSQQQKREEQHGPVRSHEHLTMSMEDLQLRPVSRRLDYENETSVNQVSPSLSAKYVIPSGQITPEILTNDPLSQLFHLQNKKANSSPETTAKSQVSSGSATSHAAVISGATDADGKTEHLHRYLQNLSQMPPPHLTSSPNQTPKSKESSPVSIAASSIHSVTSQEFIPNVLRRKAPVRHSNTSLVMSNNVSDNTGHEHLIDVPQSDHSYAAHYSGHYDGAMVGGEGVGQSKESVDAQMQLAYIEQLREELLQQQREQLASMLAEQQQQQLILQQQILQRSAMLSGQFMPSMMSGSSHSAGPSLGFPASVTSSQPSVVQLQQPPFDTSHLSMASALSHPSFSDSSLGLHNLYPNTTSLHDTSAESRPRTKSRTSKSQMKGPKLSKASKKVSPPSQPIYHSQSDSQASTLNSIASIEQTLPHDMSVLDNHATQYGEPSSLSSTLSNLTSECNLTIEQQSLLSEYLGTNLDQLNNLSTQQLLHLVSDASARASVDRPVSAPMPKVHFSVAGNGMSPSKSGVHVHYYTPEKSYHTPENSYLASPEVSTVRRAAPSRNWQEVSPSPTNSRQPPQSYRLSPLEISRIRVRLDVNNLPDWALRGFVKLTALAKGFLTRRLLHSQKVQEIIKTIRDTAEFALNFQQESPIKKGIYTSQDRNLQERVLNQLTAAMYEIHEVFFELSTTEQMALIAQTRALEQEHQERPSPAKSQEKRELSIATKKARERRRKAHEAEMAMLAHVRPKSAPPCRADNNACSKSHDLSGAIRRNYQYIISRALRPIQAQASPIKSHRDHRSVVRETSDPMRQPLLRKVSSKTKKQHPAAPVRKTASTVTNSKRTTQTQARPSKVPNVSRPAAVLKPSTHTSTTPWK